MRQKLVSRLLQAATKIDEVMIRLEDIQHDMSTDEDSGELTDILDTLRDARTAVNDLLPEPA